jgi:hypothetical protein
MTGPGREPVPVGHRALAWVRAHPGLVVLLVLPVVILGTSQSFGRVFLNGDNYLQNLPLRVLMGRDLRHGDLPLWNPYLSSGTPLLAGFNAGAAYPATWLMAVLPTFTAWTINLALVYDVAIVGMYVFLRRLSLGSTAATFGAATFAFAGFMTAQSVHIDLIEGASWLPWVALGVHGLTEPHDADRSPPDPDRRRHRLVWLAVLTVSAGLSFLTGAVESIIDSAVLVALYGLGRLVTMGYFRRDRWRALCSTVVLVALGMAGGAALGAAQWLPGAIFASNSQRSTASYSFFTSGSLPARLVTLVVSPFVLGTNQSHPGWYVGPYNFEEVTSYMGVLALIAACSLFLRTWRTRPESRHWWIWYVIVVVGLLSALGGQTPFGHLLFIVPGINSERLLSRNLLLVDFALAVLLAWWVHLLLDGRRDERVPKSRSPHSWWSGGRRSEVVVTCIPLALITAVCIFLWAGGPLLYRLLEIQFPSTSGTREKVAVLVTAGVVIAGVATWIVLSEARFTSRQLRWRLAGVLVVDLLVFNWFVVQSPITEASAQTQGATAVAFHSLVGNGRFIIYDPDQFQTLALYALGQTDLNIYDQLPSAQGYTALTSASYYAVTGAHYQEDLDPTTLAGTTWDDLNVSTLLSLPGYFVTPVTGSSTSGSISFPPHPSEYNSAPVPAVDSFRLDGGDSRRWYFGGVLTLHSFTVPLLAGQPGDLKVGLVNDTGATRWLEPTAVEVVDSGGHRSLEVTLAAPVRAGGLVVDADGHDPVDVGIPTASTTEAGTVALDGRMQYGVTSPHWIFTGMFGPFGVFHNSAAQGWAEVRATGGGPASPGSSVTAGPPAENGSQQITVHTTTDGLLVRSEAWSTGWRATIRSARTGSLSPVLTARATPVLHVGPVQGVTLPGPGTYVVTFTYAAAAAMVGLVVSAVTAAVVVIGALVAAWGWVRRRRRSSAAEGSSGISRG